jgi:hypothetical protein
MHQSLAKFSESEASNHTLSLADFTTTTPELKFSVQTGRYAMIDDGFGFSLVPWQPVLRPAHIASVMRGDGGIEWDFGKKLGLGL